MNVNSEASSRLQITMTESIVKKVEVYANSLGISRSAAISVLVSQALQAQESMGTLGEIMEAYKKEQTKKQLEE